MGYNPGMAEKVSRHKDHADGLTRTEYLYFLGLLGERLGLDLSASKLIEPEKYDRVVSLGNLFVDWLLDSRYVSYRKGKQLREEVSRSLVLTPENHLALAVAQVNERIAWIREAVAHLPVREQLRFAGEAIVGLERMRDGWLSKGLPPAMTMHILDAKNSSVSSLITYADWSENAIVPGSYSVEAAVGEEVIHTASGTIHLLDTHPNMDHGKLWQIDEVGVKYYLLKALASLRFYDAKSMLVTSNNEIALANVLWQTLAGLVGENVIDRLYFKGNVSRENLAILLILLGQSPR